MFDRIFLSLRPEAIELNERNFRSDGANGIEGKILASAYQGASIEYEIAALGRALRARITNPKGKHLFQPGDEITLGFAAEES